MGMIKTEKEIKLLKKSAQITDSCIKVIEDSLKGDITEIELRRRIRRKINSQGATIAFQTLVACGKRSSMIHPKPHATNTLIRGIGYVDFGVSYKGYKTDITVPFVRGKVSKEERKVILLTLNAYDIGVSSIKIGKYCWEPFFKVNEYLKKNGFHMVYCLGHGLGMKVHEKPLIVMPRKKKLTKKGERIWGRIKKIRFQKNMIFAIEPGIHVKGKYGCRIENDFLMTNRGAKALTHSRMIEV
jgi:Xaa-Pro aminopeptidase